jgi:hypothetical protein
MVGLMKTSKFLCHVNRFLGQDMKHVPFEYTLETLHLK